MRPRGTGPEPVRCVESSPAHGYTEPPRVLGDRFALRPASKADVSLRAPERPTNDMEAWL